MDRILAIRFEHMYYEHSIRFTIPSGGANDPISQIIRAHRNLLTRENAVKIINLRARAHQHLHFPDGQYRKAK